MAMKSILKKVFIVYVILLAGYVTFQKLIHRRYGRERASFQAPQKNCIKAGSDWTYCVHTSDLDDLSSTLYVFHGKDQSENFWTDGTTYAGLLQQYWQRKKIRHPRVVTISFGKVWIVAPPLIKHPKSLLERIHNEVIPTIEKNIGVPRRGRMLMGNSMGGLNALTYVLHQPESFKKVAILCPPVFPMSPFSSWTQLFTYAMQHGARIDSFLMTVGLGRKLVVDDKEWKQFSPLHRLETMMPPGHPPTLYITGGLRDQYGTFSATEELARKAQNKGFPVYWRPISGDHCSIDVSSLGRFFKI